MIRTPNAHEHNIAASNAEACDAVRTYLCSHEDERAWPLQRDQHNRVCDFTKDSHNLAYLSHYSHAAYIISCFAKYVRTR